MTNPITTTGQPPAAAGTERRVDSRPAAPPAADSARRERQTPATGGNSQPTVTQQRSAQDVAQATRDISDFIQTVSRSLQISVDKQLGVTVVKVLDTETAQVVRQIPAEELLEIARFLEEQQQSAESTASVKGLLMDQKG